jgi:predicted metal-binding protein
MHAVDPPVSTGLLLVCDKCGKRLKSSRDENLSRKLVARLKKASKQAFGKGEIRAALTSCLNICPEQSISVAIVPTGVSGGVAKYFTVEATDIDNTAEKIVQEARHTFAR